MLKQGLAQAISAAKKQVVKKVATSAAQSLVSNPYTLAAIALVIVVIAAFCLLAAGCAAIAVQSQQVQAVAVEIEEAEAAEVASQIAGPFVNGPVDDISAPAVAAYTQAASRSGDAVEGCVVDVAVLAAIGWKESRHGTYGGSVLDEEGTASPAIIGIALDGNNETQAIPDTDSGAFDGDTTWDRAVGPMQFIPTSWELYGGADGSGDGVSDPQNIYDAAIATTVHLCSSSSALDFTLDSEGNLSPVLERAILGYNRSTDYLNAVAARAERYHEAFSAGLCGKVGTPSNEEAADLGMVHLEIDLKACGISTEEGPISMTISTEIVNNVAQLVIDAATEGIILRGGVWRSPAKQIELRRANCGTSDYAINRKPSSQCSPPTARPGRSNHERGLAVDFTYKGQVLCYPKASAACTGNAAFNWLVRNAARYGLQNLPTEAWHWSENGK